MTREEFEQLQAQHRTSGKSLKDFLREKDIPYTTYGYWRKKVQTERQTHPIAPITIMEPRRDASENMMTGVGVSGVILAFPNGLRAHFGHGSETVLMEVLNRSLD